MRTKVVLAYVPVLHEGYLRFFSRHGDARIIYIWGDELIQNFDHLRKDARALPPHVARVAICACEAERGRDARPVRIANYRTLERLAERGILVTMPDEEESRVLAEQCLPSLADFDSSVFLRWDRGTVLAEKTVRSERVVPFGDFVGKMMQRAFVEAKQATNLWRRVGALITRDGEVLLAAHNTQVPSPNTPYYEGDPRMFFKRGLHFELTTDEHAEARLVAEAAGSGIPLRGADLFVTTFPCPPCAKLVARAGFSRIYFATGYAKLDGERILRERGIEIIQVEMKNPDA